MREYPIFFNGAMVRAILDGRKTQTRRPLDPDLQDYDGNDYIETEQGFQLITDFIPWSPGDRLWVRETWAYLSGDDLDGDLLYRADYSPNTRIYEYPCGCGFCSDDPECARWRPSIHMPRWASRILLEVTAVRVERVQEISEVDAVAEGFIARPEDCARDQFSRTWISLYAARAPWSANPWVRFTEFRVLEPSARAGY